MVSHKHKCIFVHVPKTAGQSIELFFLSLHQLNWQDKKQLLISRNEDPKRGPERLSHMRASEYYQYGYIDKGQFEEYFTFAFVRNPWERLVSEYLHKKIDRHMSLKDFVLSGLPDKNDFCDKYRHIIPQTEYLYDKDGNQLVDFIGRYENLQADFTHVCQRLGIANSTLPHRNSSNSMRRLILRKLKHFFSKKDRIKEHYSEYYDDELLDVVSKMYESDINRFNYNFERP